MSCQEEVLERYCSRFFFRPGHIFCVICINVLYVSYMSYDFVIHVNMVHMAAYFCTFYAKINYVNMQVNYFDMQHNYVDMQVANYL